MANEKLPQLKQVIQTVELDFNKLAHIHGAVNFARETSFALQLLQNSEYLRDAAFNDQDAFKRAILNVAASGLTLSPVMKEAYLVPRKINKKLQITFDPSYQGLAKLAVESGAVKWCQAVLVHAADKFEMPNLVMPPVHQFNPFATPQERGEIIGGYCVARLHNDDFMTVTMSVEEVKAIAAKYSEAFMQGKGPWADDQQRPEMIKKTLIKRATKSWPRAENSSRLLSAMRSVEEPAQIQLPPAQHDDCVADEIRGYLCDLKKKEVDYIAHVSRKFNREIKAIEQLTDIEIDTEKIQLRSWVSQQKAKEAKNENAG